MYINVLLYVIVRSLKVMSTQYGCGCVVESGGVVGFVGVNGGESVSSS
jgi:hypothetical protein